MKVTGVVRRIDDLGRVVIPREIRERLGIREGDPLEAYEINGGVLFKKREPSCVFCGSEEDLVMVEGKTICLKCGKRVRNIMNEKV